MKQIDNWSFKITKKPQISTLVLNQTIKLVALTTRQVCYHLENYQARWRSQVSKFGLWSGQLLQQRFLTKLLYSSRTWLGVAPRTDTKTWSCFKKLGLYAQKNTVTIRSSTTTIVEGNLYKTSNEHKKTLHFNNG